MKHSKLVNLIEESLQGLGDVFLHGERGATILAALSAAGQVVVPSEPTTAMMIAGQNAQRDHPYAFSSIYRAMITEAGGKDG